MAEAAATIAGVIGEAAFDGDAHAFLMSVYKNPENPIDLRADAAKAAIRYEKPALSSVDAKVENSITLIAALGDNELDSIIRRSATEAQVSFGVAGEGAETKH